MQNHVMRLHEESKTLPPNLPPRTSRWLIAIYGAGVLPLAIFALGFFSGTVGALFPPYMQYWLQNELANLGVSLAMLTFFLVQLVAFVGLTVRRDWALGLANLTCLMWCFSGVGILPAALVYWWLRRSWSHNQTGVAADVPGSVQTFFGVTTFLVLGWIAYVIYLDLLIRSIFAGVKLDPAGADPIVATAFVMGLPTYLLQGAAFYGLRFRKVWGREAATLAAIVIAFTVVGIPFSYWALKKMWPTTAAGPVPAGAPA